MVLEVIATTAGDAKIAEKGGADRIELITGILEGGLTPSYGLIEEAVQAVAIPVNVMVRPHSQSFMYNEDDIRTMVKDIQIVKQIGAAGVVIGCLTEERQIDVETLKRLLDAAEGLDVTFHRAFDEAADQEKALEELLRFKQIKRILTSGGKKSVLDAQEQMIKLVQKTEQTHLSIMAGSGLTIPALKRFIETTRVKEVHFGTGVRFKQHALEPVDAERVKKVKQILQG
ncbi:copper homeostasis protein CutC [Fictibacillus gelatini]|uniref:copper homeostasis protein CutC n=1 Tax=Fictibacillus gelatini TaxID=225985 RepID=UPI0004106759|nr:copper homeostasis protein CutC [Fictibacillus gelatini]